MRREEAGRRWKVLGAKEKVPFLKQPGRSGRRPRFLTKLLSRSFGISIGSTLRLCEELYALCMPEPVKEWGSVSRYLFVLLFGIKVVST